MRQGIELLLRAAGAPDPERAEALWAEYRAGGAGADAAFTTLLAWYGGTVYRRIWGFVRSDAADDVFQDVLAALHRERGRLATFAHALRWLCTVAVTRCVDAHRRATRQKAREQARAVPVETTPTAGERFDLNEALRVGLAKLSPREQQAIALVFFEGMSRQDAAAVAGVHRDTFAKTLDGALAKLRSALAAAALLGAAATTASLEAALVARSELSTPARLAGLAAGAWGKAATAPRLRAWPRLTGSKLLAGLAVGGVVLVSLALVTGSLFMPTTAKPSARLGVERLEARDNPSGGLLDPTFGVGGMADVPAIDNSTVTALATQPDNKVLAVGSSSSVTRLNANGTLDATFGTNGSVRLSVAKGFLAKGVALQPDGKILVAGSAFTRSSPLGGVSDSEYAVARLNANGTLDTTFGGANTGWWVSNPTPDSEAVSTLVVAPSGPSWSIYAGGSTGSSVVVVKLTAAGQPDATYGLGGVASRSAPGGVPDPLPLVVTPSGRAVVACGPLYAFTQSGQVDAGFGTNGVVTPSLYTGVRAMTAQGESVIAAGYRQGTSGPAASPTGVGIGVITRFTPTGTVDTTFGTAGEFRGPSVGGATPTASSFGSVTVAGDGTIVAAGAIARKDAAGVVTRGVLLARLTPAGQPDTTFGVTPDGSGTVARFDVDSNLWANNIGSQLPVAVDADGNIVLGSGLRNPTGPTRAKVLRFTGG